MNAHQRRKARRAKTSDVVAVSMGPYVAFIHANHQEARMKALKGDGTVTLPAGVPLIRGETGPVDCGITFISPPGTPHASADTPPPR